uniref:Putative ovule protein n=1 Tax=Solanum chacoense TaxID=4108 RepID=A0A0V0GJZ7_SOLCH
MEGFCGHWWWSGCCLMVGFWSGFCRWRRLGFCACCGRFQWSNDYGGLGGCFSGATCCFGEEMGEV